MSFAIPFDLAIFLLGTFAAAFVTGLAGFAFGMVAAGIWLFALTPVQTTTLILAYALLVQGYSTWRLRRTILPSRLLPFVVGSAVGIPAGIVILELASAVHLRCRPAVDRLQPLQSAATENAGLEKCWASRGCWRWIPPWRAGWLDRARWYSPDLVVRIARLAPRRASVGITADRSRNLCVVAAGLWRDGVGHTGNDPAVLDRPTGACCRNAARLVALWQTG